MNKRTVVTWGAVFFFIAICAVIFCLANVNRESMDYRKTNGFRNACSDSAVCKKCENDAKQVLQERLESEKQEEILRDFEIFDLNIDKEETIRQIKLTSGSELAKGKGWTTNFLETSFIIVRANYYVQYYWNKSPNFNGNMTEYLWMIYDKEEDKWSRIDGMIVPNNTGSKAEQS